MSPISLGPQAWGCLVAKDEPSPQVDTKPASDIIAGAVARAASQGTIHPLDTLKVRMQAQGGLKGPLSKIGKLLPPAGALSDQQLRCAKPDAKEMSLTTYAPPVGHNEHLKTLQGPWDSPAFQHVLT